MFKFFRQQLFWRIFLSYLVVILTGIGVMVLATSFISPQVIRQHMADMDMPANAQGKGNQTGMMMGNNPNAPGTNMGSNGARIFSSYKNAINEAMTLAGLSAILAAILAGAIVSKQMITPIQHMIAATQKITGGHYEERVPLSKNIAPEDRNELEQLADQFNIMAESIENTESMRRQLIGDVSHELRTPLTTIKGSMEGLIDGVLPTDPETFENIYQEADRLQRLVEDLQELSRVESGAIKLSPKAIDLNKVIASVAERLSNQFNEKGVGLSIDTPSEIPPVLSDEDRTRQILINLMGNALQYTQSGGNVTVYTKQLSNEIQISIKDTGIGISEVQIPLIFTRFYRVDKSRARVGGGSGIGLTIVKYLVEAQGGKIWAQSPGIHKGSTFNFTLPLYSKGE